MPYSILVADDHPLFVAGIVTEIDAQSDMEVVGTSESGEEAVEKTLNLRPDVLVLDMQLPDMDGTEVAAKLMARGTATNILPLSGFADPEYVMGLIEIGVDGYVLKSESVSSVVEAIRTVAQGGVYVSSEAAVFAMSAQRLRAREINISAAQEEVLKLAATGMSNGEIAERLHRSKYTVRNHICALRESTGTSSRAQLVAWAWQRGIVSEN